MTQEEREFKQTYINDLNQALIKFMSYRGSILYVCHVMAKVSVEQDVLPNQKLEKLSEKYPQFSEWITKVGRKYREDYAPGEAWSHDKREELGLVGREYIEDDYEEDVNGDEVLIYPYLSIKEKIKELQKYIDKLTTEL